MHTKYSIIVPVYNVEKVLCRCIDSILRQTITDFELILINDGSKDGSGQICDQYAQKDKRIQVIHQQNGGVSKARNAGLGIAKGKYIVFVDSDDAVEPNYLEVFDNENSDLVISGFNIFEKGKQINAMNISGAVISAVDENNIISILKEWYSSQVCGKRFISDIIKANKLFFDEEVNFGEDSLFFANYSTYIGSVVIKADTTYLYYLDDETSLGRISDDIWFAKYSATQKKIFDVYDKFNKVQVYLAEKYCWLTETELVKICKSNKTTKAKLNALRKVLNNEHLDCCVDICNKNLSRRIKLIFKLKSAFLALCIYSKS